MSGPKRFAWSRGSRLTLYGLWRLDQIRAAGWCLLVEGESDCHTAWLHGLPALGAPGADTWKAEWARHLEGVRAVVWAEPDHGGEALLSRLCHSLPQGEVLSPPEGLKDLSQAHVEDQDVVALVTELRGRARPLASAWPDALTEARTLSDLRPWVREQLARGASREAKLTVAQTLAQWLLAHQRLVVDIGQDGSRGGRSYLIIDDGALWPLERDARPTELTLHLPA